MESCYFSCRNLMKLSKSDDVRLNNNKANIKKKLEYLKVLFYYPNRF